MRVLKFSLEANITEILITNIFDEDFTVADFKELYFKRWGIEVKYNEIKNKLQIENFTGETPIAIEQDFYATMHLVNIVALAKMDANEIIEEEYKDKNLKYEYKVNTNILIAKLKNTLIMMISTNNPWKRRHMLRYIGTEIEKNAMLIRPYRSFKRKVRRETRKVNILNKKRVLQYNNISLYVKICMDYMEVYLSCLKLQIRKYL